MCVWGGPQPCREKVRPGGWLFPLHTDDKGSGTSQQTSPAVKACELPTAQSHNCRSRPLTLVSSGKKPHSKVSPYFILEQILQ